MAVDLSALERAAAGNSGAEVIVTKRWLGEVHRALVEAKEFRENLPLFNIQRVEADD